MKNLLVSIAASFGDCVIQGCGYVIGGMIAFAVIGIIF